jgi:iron-sulfur cluster assembly protein
MFEITNNAALQILESAQKTQAEGLALRIEVRETPADGFQYLVGFDQIKAEDVHLVCSGVDVIFSQKSKPLLSGAKMDFVAVDGEMNFIFLNPNDPMYQPPKED